MSVVVTIRQESCTNCEHKGKAQSDASFYCKLNDTTYLQDPQACEDWMPKASLSNSEYDCD